jgi:hypothetical protein
MGEQMMANDQIIESSNDSSKEVEQALRDLNKRNRFWLREAFLGLMSGPGLAACFGLGALPFFLVPLPILGAIAAAVTLGYWLSSAVKHDLLPLYVAAIFGVVLMGGLVLALSFVAPVLPFLISINIGLNLLTLSSAFAVGFVFQYLVSFLDEYTKRSFQSNPEPAPAQPPSQNRKSSDDSKDDEHKLDNDYKDDGQVQEIVELVKKELQSEQNNLADRKLANNALSYQYELPGLSYKQVEIIRLEIENAFRNLIVFSISPNNPLSGTYLLCARNLTKYWTDAIEQIQINQNQIHKIPLVGLRGLKQIEEVLKAVRDKFSDLVIYDFEEADGSYSLHSMTVDQYCKQLEDRIKPMVKPQLPLNLLSPSPNANPRMAEHEFSLVDGLNPDQLSAVVANVQADFKDFVVFYHKNEDKLRVMGVGAYYMYLGQQIVACQERLQGKLPEQQREVMSFPMPPQQANEILKLLGNQNNLPKGFFLSYKQVDNNIQLRVMSVDAYCNRLGQKIEACRKRLCEGQSQVISFTVLAEQAEEIAKKIEAKYNDVDPSPIELAIEDNHGSNNSSKLLRITCKCPQVAPVRSAGAFPFNAQEAVVVGNQQQHQQNQGGDVQPHQQNQMGSI